MSVGLKVTVYNESGAFLAAGWKKHSGYTLSGINELENILTLIMVLYHFLMIIKMYA